MGSTKARILAAVAILFIVCGFVIALLVLGVSPEVALFTAGGVGLVAAEIVRRLLPPDSPESAGGKTA